MPTYDYECSACHHKFEQYQSITAPAITKCPECGKNKVKRLIGTGAGIIFKGSGFYITDYRSDSYKAAAKAEASGGESKASGGDSKSSNGSKTSAEAKSTASGGNGAKTKSKD
ncbi:MAG TPA: zinc ribbon domain-containing protein [Phycisphaerae bacterium]|nr:zinc ribbon domain-containing protein [Phycisphaerae bacterium]HOM50257.1 zinc ribbon domain-containing protein [Phycisphaerae bacterium]HON66480.1 zinc ribbon domain-containing protein [Phycisphaerae bacterium]HPP27562.1 zinc ribbon domain-containing protein [Phycisphaerae bacterium]